MLSLRLQESCVLPDLQFPDHPADDVDVILRILSNPLGRIERIAGDKQQVFAFKLNGL